MDCGKVYTHPIAGTRKRGKDAVEDAALARELLADEKERAERKHMLVAFVCVYTRVCGQRRCGGCCTRASYSRKRKKRAELFQ